MKSGRDRPRGGDGGTDAIERSLGGTGRGRGVERIGSRTGTGSRTVMAGGGAIAAAAAAAGRSGGGNGAIPAGDTLGRSGGALMDEADTGAGLGSADATS